MLSPKAIVAAIFFTIIAVGASGRQLTPEQALVRAGVVNAGKMTNNAYGSATVLPTLCFTDSVGDMATVYIFNRGENGFYVVSADDAAQRALLGYSDSGSINPTALPDNFRWWLGCYGREIAMAAQARGRTVESDGNGGGSDVRASLTPLLATRWDQLAPYNSMCPKLEGNNAPTGCVATAMAQAMRHFSWPEKGVGQHSYYPNYVGSELSVDFAAATYDWADMTDTYSDASTEAQKKAVAMLMYHCGVAVNMDYGPESSGADFREAAVALVKYFDYDRGVHSLSRDCYGIDEWTDMVYGEIAAGRPVLYSGRNAEVGHAFVADGYDSDGFFHFNWGWGGWSNGYFVLTALNPEQQGTGGGTDGYNSGQCAIFGLQKPMEGSRIYPVVEFEGSFSTAGRAYSRTSETITVECIGGMFCRSTGDVNVKLGLKLVSSSGKEYKVYGEERTMRPGEGIVSYEVPVDSFPGVGFYRAYPGMLYVDGQWYENMVPLDKAGSLRVNVTADSIIFTPDVEASLIVSDIEVFTPIYPGLDAGIRARLRNDGTEEFYSAVYPALFVKSEEQSQAEGFEVDILPGEEAEVEWVGAFERPLAAGHYTLRFIDAYAKLLEGDSLSVEVKEAPAEATDYSVVVTASSGAGSGISEDEPVVITDSEVVFNVAITCHSGYYHDFMNGGIYQADRGVVGVTGSFVGVPAGETRTVTLKPEMKYLQPGKVYHIYAASKNGGHVGEPLYFSFGTMGIDFAASDCQDGLRFTENPARGRVGICHVGGIRSAMLVSMTGLVVQTAVFAGENQVDMELTDCPGGLYVVICELGDGSRVSGRLVVVR